MSARAAIGPKATAAATTRAHFFMMFLPERFVYRWRDSITRNAMSQDKGWGSYYDKLRDRPPRRTLIAALDAFGERDDALAVDLGCGDGRDVVEILRRGWKVVAVDSEPEALRRLMERGLPGSVTPIEARLEDVPMPIGVELVNSSFALPLCEPERFHDLWARIVEALPSGGRFS